MGRGGLVRFSVVRGSQLLISCLRDLGLQSSFLEGKMPAWLKKEQEEKEQKRKEKAKAHLYTIIKVARDEDLLEQIGRDIYFDLVDHDKVRSFCIQKQMPFNLFKREIWAVRIREQLWLIAVLEQLSGFGDGMGRGGLVRFSVVRALSCSSHVSAIWDSSQASWKGRCQRLKKEQEEKEQKRKEKAKAHLYTIIKVARDEDLLEQIGRDIYFDLVDHDKVRSFCIQKQMPFNLFKISQVMDASREHLYK
ncbi:unnamed protein product [Camellia sinensis]